jgi:hypothetical protein
MEDLGRISEYLNRISRGAIKLADTLEEFSELTRYVTDKIKYIRRELDRLERELGAAAKRKVSRPDTPEDTEEYLYNINNLKIEATKILWKEILTAVAINKEYNHPFFLGRLERVARNPETIDITMSNSYPIVQIYMNEVAGSLEDYADGVKSAREHFKIRSPHRMSSWFWQEKYYGQARENRPLPGKRKKRESAENKKEALINKYWETMQFRMDASGKIAPFWELLDKGAIPMSSDWGGQPYPRGIATDFVNRAIEEITHFIKNPEEKKEKKDEGLSDAEIIRENIRNTEIGLAEYEDALRELEELADEASSFTEEEEEAYDRLSDRIERNMDRVDRTKLANVEIALKTKDFSRISITGELRVELSRRGEKRYRPSLREVALMLGYEYNE